MQFAYKLLGEATATSTRSNKAVHGCENTANVLFAVANEKNVRSELTAGSLAEASRCRNFIARASCCSVCFGSKASSESSNSLLDDWR